MTRIEAGGHAMTYTCHDCTWQGPTEPTWTAAVLDLHRALHPLLLTVAYAIAGPILRRLP